MIAISGGQNLNSALKHFDQITRMSARSFTLHISSTHRLRAHSDGQSKVNVGLLLFFTKKNKKQQII